MREVAGTRSSNRRIARFLRDETVGGGLVLAAALLGIVIANSPLAVGYTSLLDQIVGPASLHLDLSLRHWVADGFLSLFFFVVGIELKQEILHGSLSRPARAAQPIAAAVGGMLLPALLYLLVNTLLPNGATRGWGIPMATDIAFALAVLAVAGRGLPLSLRAFLLTLAIVDDLGAIFVIAIVYSESLAIVPLLVATGAAVAFWGAQRARIRFLPLYVGLALATWFGLHEGGVHATLTGVLLAFGLRTTRDPGENESPASRVERVVHPWSAGVAVPLFAFTAAGVPLATENVGELLGSPILLGILAGLLVGKPIGIYAGARIAGRLFRTGPPEGSHWSDVAAIGIVAGVGFTVSLLIAGLAFPDPGQASIARLGVVAASLLAAFAAAVLLCLRTRS